MKRLFKGILFFLLGIILLVGGTILFLYLKISDSTDLAPIELYNDSITIDQELENLFSKALSDNKNYDFTLSEDELNILIFAFIRESLNENYYDSGCTSDACQYVLTESLDSSIPIVGGKKIILKHIYAVYKENGLEVYATVDVLGVKTNLNFGFEIEEDDDNFKVIINKVGLGKLNVMKGLGKLVRKPVMKALGFAESDINETLIEKKLPITFTEKDFSFSFEKGNIGQILATLLVPDGEEDKNDIIKELFSVLTNPEDGILSFGFFGTDEISFGARIDLTPFAANEVTYNNKIAEISNPIDADNFIKNKTMGVLFNNLIDNEIKIIFTANEFNRLLYDKTNGYSDFEYSFSFTEGAPAFSFKVTGVALEIESPTKVYFHFLVEINDLHSIMTLTGTIQTAVSEDEIKIVLDENLLVGSVTIKAKFLIDMIGGNASSFAIMSYDSEEKAFIITEETFNQFMDVGGEDTPLRINKLRFITGALEAQAIVDDPALQGLINDVGDLINDLLGSDFLNTSGFSTQDDIVEDLSDALEEIMTTLNDPNEELSPEQIDELLDIINQLSDENQDELFNQIEDAISNQDLLDLYDSLFGN